MSKKKNSMKREFLWALMMSAMLLVWLTVLMMLGFQEGAKAEFFPLVNSVFYIILFALYFFAIKGRRSLQRGYITRRDAFLTGLIITLFLVVLSPLNMSIFYYVINPNFINVMVEMAVDNGVNLQQAQNDHNVYNYIFSSMLINFVAGGVFSALGALFLQKIPNKQQYEPLA